MKSLIPAYVLLFSLVIFSCSQETMDERLSREAREYTTRYCPKPLDEVVTLDSVVYYLPQKNESGRYAYFHTVECDSMTILNLIEQRDYVRDELLSKINNAQDMTYLKEHGVTIQYTFYTKIEKQIIYDFRYTKGMYK